MYVIVLVAEYHEQEKDMEKEMVNSDMEVKAKANSAKTVDTKDGNKMAARQKVMIKVEAKD
jgi:hypothetical protein